MSKVMSLFLSDNANRKTQKLYYHFHHHLNLSFFSSVIIVLSHIAAWTFLKLESPSWQWVRENHQFWFPHISRKHPRSGDFFRYLIQSLWLLIFRPIPHKTSDKPNLMQRSLNYYYSLIEKIPAQIENNILTQKTTQQFEQTSSGMRRIIFIILGLFSAVLLLICITQPFKPLAQFIFVVLLWGMAMSIRKAPGHVSTILLVVLSVIVSSRYLWWRYTYTLVWDDFSSTLFGSLLIFAETYIWLVMILGYFQSLWPLHRKPVPLPADQATWPSVDIMITTYNEDLSILKPGIYSALGLDWPKDKLNIYILDDGNRPEFKAFAEEVGVHYIARPTHEHAKAGNINYALKRSKGDLIAIFDCDYVITHPFLQLTVGWFLKDPKLAIVQTPHHFFSPDPFERNLKSFRKTPNESSLFYGVVQDGNDTWNATYFCGSSGIMRRSALEKIGGLAVESVTEDAHTSLRLQRLGFNSAYIRIPLAAGLATESLASHVAQRIRWARGMVQILRMDNPLLGKGLAFGQRLCYFNAMLHFLSGVPRLIFFITPAAFLVLNAYVVYASGVMILLYAIPHIVHAILTNDRIQGRFRHFLWNEIYETVMAWYIAVPTTMALINPHKGRFNVTPKGKVISEEHVDWITARPYIVLLCINIAGLIAAAFRLTVDPAPTILAVIITTIWTLYNITILGGALGVSIEAKQRRRAPRVTFVMPAAISRPDGHVYQCVLRNYSDKGVGIQLEEPNLLKAGDEITLLLKRGQDEFAFPGTVAFSFNRNAGIRLHEFTLRQNIDFIQCTFARADVWSLWQESFDQDKPLKSMRDVFVLDLRGYYDIIEYTPNRIRRILLAINKAFIWLGTFLPHKPKPRGHLEA
ncbi:UDP-forming cellulose synthase catalytic subunit [Fluoribacter dumoffii]|uniref:UDP-forming cellulose synthase catalytic subunit n=1 Tax=Fluoribacter dumoffii TaxID=463 RepID=UPI002242E93B|nr:UDP-forming cellulose synthase catalytic subunit [Fluoribacter dumoffii]MCW8384937.1 UDP-forming cellulose synthase catalytic subunit [Fluoribacter dumoffii]MCW8417998.1 UDP-forming cellulose synthase catalytic subunit [Fluoribacter dumoffii]MCW8454160.1 UDP-forming cellulose synthase catalytic subunit [Fluoribacter dumoffii]MCW8461766.1 UDP-forming cellulose synthase catalytic subunit [Fluoribacter dumoffii]MCW8481982.1 UDP-forming cellulose synthase catalytic subunit [Fluoribacter dumoffi